MKIKIFLIFLFSYILILANIEVEKDVLVGGYGISREKALNDAFKEAVRQVVGVVIDSETILFNEKIIKDEILTASNGYIVKFDIISEEKDEEIYKIKIKADVATQNIRDKIKALNIASFKMDGNNLKNKIIEQQTKAISEQEKSTLTEKYLNEFFVTLRNANSGLVQLKIADVKFDEKQVKNNELLFRINYEVNYNYSVYSNMIEELEDKFKNLGLKVKKRVKIFNNLNELTKGLLEINYYRSNLDHIVINKNQLVIVKKMGLKYTLDIWELPIELDNFFYSYNYRQLQLHNLKGYYEFLVNKETINIGYTEFYGASLVELSTGAGSARYLYNIAPTYIYPFFFYASKMTSKFSGVISDSIDLNSVDIFDLKDLELKLILENN